MVHTLPVNGRAPAGRKLATTSTTTGAATRPRTISVRSRGKIVPRTCSGQMDNPLYRRAAAVTVAIFPLLLTDATHISRDQWCSNHKFTSQHLTLSVLSARISMRDILYTTSTYPLFQCVV